MSAPDIEAVVFDILGTLVDEPSGIRAGIRAHARTVTESDLDELQALWQSHVEGEQSRILGGGRPWAPSHVLDREAAQLVADAVGGTDPAGVARLSLAGRELLPWPDTVAGLERLAARFPLIGLSNAGRTALLGLNAHAGLRWHQALSAEDARTYKPAPEVYELAIALAAVSPDRLLMVAAHAWDLRGAQAVGLRTAYVARPGGDPPAPADRFDLHADGLDDLADQLADGVEPPGAGVVDNGGARSR